MHVVAGEVGFTVGVPVQADAAIATDGRQAGGGGRRQQAPVVAPQMKIPLQPGPFDGAGARTTLHSW